MPNKMLVDASHPEETRVVVVRGNRIEEFDFESQDKKQLKGNIYLARVTRVEPSLQAAFVEYGGNRHGFLAFSEIHPDYYQIPVADRQALLRAEAEEHEDEDDDANGNGNGNAESNGEERHDRGRGRKRRRGGRNRSRNGDESRHAAEASDEEAAAVAEGEHDDHAGDEVSGDDEHGSHAEPVAEVEGGESAEDGTEDSGSSSIAATVDADVISEPVPASDEESAPSENEHRGVVEEIAGAHDDDHGIEIVGAEDAMEEARTRRKPMRRQYKIQEVIKRRQILLVQVVKEERGNKGAALTTYLSLAGRYSVLMPNTARGGGISRKITNAQDRKRLKEVVQELEVPQGMGVILRTAGESRTKAEIKRDYEYLMRMWENVRSLTMQSVAPALVYEEGSLIKRSVRDLYNKDIDEILVAGEEGYREAKDFMRMLMPSHAKVVQPYRDTTPIFARNGIEAQLDRMLQPQVTLKSGGYIIINQTEALVAIDVNSGRSTKEHSIEDTALQTNLEAAEEVARQLRLRDLAGLIVIDFIDMEENRNNRAVEKKLKDCLKNDRARIQVGRISHFGLMEMSRQRIRASVLESTMKPCPHCGGTGHIRSDSSVALLVIRAIEEFLLKDSRHHITVRTPGATAFYVLNHKRSTLVELEQRFGLTISLEPDESVGSQHYAISRGAVVEKPVTPQPVLPSASYIEPEEIEEEEVVEEEEAEEVHAEQPARAEKHEEEDHRDRKRRKRRRRRGRDREHGAPAEAETVAEAVEGEEEEAGEPEEAGVAAVAASADDADRKKRRRGKRGGRRNRKEEGEAGHADEAVEAEAAEGEEVEASAVVEAVSEEAALEPAAEEPAAVEAATAEEAPAEKPKKTTRRTTRSKKAAAEEAPAVTEAAATEATEAPAEEKPAKKPRAPRRKAAAEPAPAPEAAEVAPEAPAEAPVAEETAAPVNDQPAPAEEPQPEVEEKPKKTGWWQRKSFF
ncbi:ribonuclease E [Mesorhizobium soli]|uniref:Rne/Rng family ribonuclease n=1 Tax=Pseudaminobacter soli (ex Li et al. 2025) TaxID=1295366 RepID=UPI002475B7BC|nr:ribonuclease E/G [Mesorhizobium soli]MDH6232935.1 ribonuclease E [Mesorhizobium soli]